MNLLQVLYQLGSLAVCLAKHVPYTLGYCLIKVVRGEDTELNLLSLDRNGCGRKCKRGNQERIGQLRKEGMTVRDVATVCAESANHLVCRNSRTEVDLLLIYFVHRCVRTNLSSS